MAHLTIRGSVADRWISVGRIHSTVLASSSHFDRRAHYCTFTETGYRLSKIVKEVAR